MGKINKGVMSSNSNEWETPQKLYEEINKEFNFDLDVASTHENHKCDNYYTQEDDGLKQLWYGNVWCNPPYGREIRHWVEKAYNDSLNNPLINVIVFLIPARTCTSYFHDFIYKKENVEIRFLRGRVKFVQGDIDNQPAPFPSMLVIFKPLSQK